jgi:hypothetical protein
VKTVAKLIRNSGSIFCRAVAPPHVMKIDKPTPVTSKALRMRCLSSVGLNQKILLFG